MGRCTERTKCLGGVVMINVNYQINNDAIRLSIKGHADEHQPENNFNAVCGMVSVLAESCLWGCSQYSKSEVISRESGNLDFWCESNEKTRAIITTCVEGIKQVALQFPHCFGGVTNGA